MSISNNDLPAEKLVKEGMKAFQSGDYPSAINLFLIAHSGFLSQNNILSAAETANNLSVCCLKQGNAQKAYDYAAGTDELFAQAGDFRRRAMAVGNLAAALEKLGDSNRAVEKYEESSRLFKQVGDLESRTIILKSLSELQLKMGYQLEAMATMRIALMSKKKPSLIERLLQKLLKIPFGS